MLTPSRTSSRAGGFTLVEMAFVLLLLSIVVAVAMNALISLDNAESRNDAVVQHEQTASRLMAQLERDIRSASTITIPAGASAADQLELADLGSGGATTQVRWVYAPASGTLTRLVQVAGAWPSSGDAVSGVSNGTGTPVFTYYDSSAADISARINSEITSCATAVGVDLLIGGGSGARPYSETAQVALTNQALELTDPGDGWCVG